MAADTLALIVPRVYPQLGAIIDEVTALAPSAA
jgi:hypothetical protein